MAKYRYVHCAFWKDPFVQKLTPEEKYFYLYLMTNEYTSQCGIYEITRKTMSFDTGYNDETIDKLLKRFTDYGKIHFDEENNELMLINWIKYNTTSSPKVRKCIEGELKTVKTAAFVNAYLENWKEAGYPLDTLSIPYPYGTDTVCKAYRKEKEKEKEKENITTTVVFEDIPEEKRTKKDYIEKMASYFGDDFKKAAAFFKTNKPSNWRYAIWVMDRFKERIFDSDDPFKYAMGLFQKDDVFRLFMAEEHSKQRELEEAV